MSRYTIIGAGAIGGLVGSALAATGHKVTFVEANPDHRAAIARDGLVVSGYRDRVAKVPVIAPEELAPGQQAVLVAVKSIHTPAAIEVLRGKLAQDGVVVSLQNGLNEYQLAEAFGALRVVGAFLTFGGYVEGPGRITYAGDGSFRIGELDGSGSARVRQLAADFGAHQPCEVTDNIFGFLWGKMVLGAVYYGTAVLDLPVVEIYADPLARSVLGQAAREAALVGMANGVRLETIDGFDPTAFTRGDAGAIADSWRAQHDYWAGHVGAGRTGIWRDLSVHRRKTEASAHLGAVIGRRGDLRTPMLDRIYACVTEIEQGTRLSSWGNLGWLAEVLPEGGDI